MVLYCQYILRYVDINGMKYPVNFILLKNFYC